MIYITGMGTKTCGPYISIFADDISGIICMEYHSRMGKAMISLENHSSAKICRPYISISEHDISAKICTEGHRGMGNARISLKNHSGLGRNSSNKT